MITRRICAIDRLSEPSGRTEPSAEMRTLMQNKSDSPNLTMAQNPMTQSPVAQSPAPQNPRVNKSGDYRKTARISVGVTASEKRRFIAAAEASEKRFSDFVRDALLRAAARVENEDDGP